MKFEWDQKKAHLNDRKHGVQFADAVSVLDDDNALTTSEHWPDGEERFVTLGTDSLGRILVVVYVWRQEKVRIISARKATPGEQKRYAEVP
jgi:uncharacterized DUF497 family protein